MKDNENTDGTCNLGGIEFSVGSFTASVDNASASLTPAKEFFASGYRSRRIIEAGLRQIMHLSDDEINQFFEDAIALGKTACPQREIESGLISMLTHLNCERASKYVKFYSFDSVGDAIIQRVRTKEYEGDDIASALLYLHWYSDESHVDGNSITYENCTALEAIEAAFSAVADQLKQRKESVWIRNLFGGGINET